MKAILTLLILCAAGAAHAAKPPIEVPFAKQKQKVVVTVEKSRCDSTGPKAYTLETDVPDVSYRLVCKLRPPIDQYDSATPIRLVENFKFPETILRDIESSEFVEVKKQGAKAIKTEKRPWGREYRWATPTMGTAFHTYLCPKRAKHCFYVVHGGIEFLKFAVK